MKKLFKTASVILCVIMTATVLTSCHASDNTVIVTPENKDSLTYEVAKVWEHKEPDKVYYYNLGEDVMPIVGFWGPYKETAFGGSEIPSLETDEMFQAIQDCGVNIIWQDNYNYDKDKKEVLNYLDMCAKYNMGFVVKDSALYELIRGWENPHADLSKIKMGQEGFNARISEYVNHPGFGGLSVIDEAPPSMRDTIKTVTDMYKSAEKTLNLKKSPMWYNLFPMGYVTNREGYDYKLYLKEMGTSLGYISYDQYPFEWDRTDDINSSFFTNLNAVYDVAKENNLPFWAFVQMGGSWTNVWDEHTGVKPPAIDQIIWEINTFLCYGAKGLQYYTMNMPHSTFDYIQANGELGMFDPYGNKTKYYHAVKIADEQIKACDEYLMNATHHGLISTGYIMGGNKTSIVSIPDRKFRELINISEDKPSLIGCFDYKGKTMIYLMNSSYQDDTSVKLTFDNKYCYDIIQRGQKIKAVGSNLSFRLSPSESVLIVLN